MIVRLLLLFCLTIGPSVSIAAKSGVTVPANTENGETVNGNEDGKPAPSGIEGQARKYLGDEAVDKIKGVVGDLFKEEKTYRLPAPEQLDTNEWSCKCDAFGQITTKDENRNTVAISGTPTEPHISLIIDEKKKIVTYISAHLMKRGQAKPNIFKIIRKTEYGSIVATNTNGYSHEALLISRRIGRVSHTLATPGIVQAHYCHCK